MATFHESIKSLIAEVERFINDTLKNEKLGKAAKSHKQELLDLIFKLRDEYPGLNANANSDHVKQTKDRDDESTRTGGSSNADDTEDPYCDSSVDIPKVSAMELTDFTKAGFLDKKKPTGIIQSMQRRWCVVKGNIFYYFSDKTSKKQSGAFRLVDYSFEEAPELEKDKKKKELCFKLVRPANRTYEKEVLLPLFAAPNKTEFEEWKTAVKTASTVTKQPDISPFDDDGDIYEPVGEDDKQEAPEEPQELYDDASQGDIYEAEPIALPKEQEPEPTQDDIYDEGMSAAVQEEMYEDASTPAPPSVPPPVSPSVPPLVKRAPLPELPDESPYQSRPLPPVRSDAGPPPVIPRKADELPPPPLPPIITKEEPKSYRREEDFENMFVGKWDCNGDDEKELSFKKGDIVYIINRDFDEKLWWVGELDGKFGLVPKNYLTAAYELACTF